MPANNLKHGMNRTRVHRIWCAMRQRCYNPKRDGYENYGGRGIKVCKRWNRFENFLEDMGIPKDGESIDRIDSNGDYTPKNCRWADRRVQNSNQKKNVYVEYEKEKMTVTELARRIGVRQQSLHWRLKRMNVEEAISDLKSNPPKKKSSINIAEEARIRGLNKSTVHNRIARGWTIERALS